jgi:hypothetical protein
MKARTWPVVAAVILSTMLGAVQVPIATAKKPPKPPPPPPPPSTSTVYVRDIASVIDAKKCDLTPEAVQATSDGGSIALALSGRPNDAASPDCSGVSWLVKLDAFGNPQWQKAVGCFGLPPGSYSFGVSLDQTGDGGYVLGGGTIGCGSDTLCPFLGGLQCCLIQRLDPNGNLVWAKVYSSGKDDRDSSINQIRRTSDGGFIAAGSFRDLNSHIGAWILKVGSAGTVQWQSKLGPGGVTGPGSDPVSFNAVRPTADGGFVAAGEFTSYARRAEGDTGVLVVKLNANGNVAWQRGFNRLDSNGAPTASEHALSVIQTSGGSFLVAGNWVTATGPGTCCTGGLLLKLDANGNSQWQKAYHAGVHCFFNGFNTTCHAIGALTYSVRQAADGGFVMAGATNLKFNDSSPMVPWLAKTDASGNLLWQHAYYRTYPTGRPISQYFAASDLAGNGGHLAVGFTEDPADFIGELFAVKTDAAGLVGSCGAVHPATELMTVDPSLATIQASLPMLSTGAVQGDAPSTSQSTSISTAGGATC